MAHWNDFNINDVITMIESREIMLPVIQRRIEWDEEQMTLLFDSLFRQNSFGSVICIEECRGDKPLFACRYFSSDGTPVQSRELDKLDRNMLLVIDGQQRLQSFYIGLRGSYHGETMYYDLMSNYEEMEYDFRFEASQDKLPKTSKSASEARAHMWYSVPVLFRKLRSTFNTKLVVKEIIQELGVTDSVQEEFIRENIKDFSERIFTDKSIGISKVAAHMFGSDVFADRARITELFRRLNDGGTRLSSYDLLASSLKCFDYTTEGFIEKIEAEDSSIGINKDSFINLLLVLLDKPDKSMTDMDDEDAKLITGNRVRIEHTLKVLKWFLDTTKHAGWFTSKRKKSAIPVYLLAYHIFYRDCTDEEILHLFDNYDVSNPDFSRMLKWLKLSLLNSVFSYGCGWRINKGLRKLHEVMRANKGSSFPVSQMFRTYRENLHRFFDEKQIYPSTLDMLDEEYIFFLIYGRPKQLVRIEDKDHIHPRSILMEADVDEQKIDSIGNLQLIDAKTNRVRKSSKEFGEWLKDITDRSSYLNIHLIPDVPSLWYSDRFDDFLQARLQKIASKIMLNL